MGMQEILSTHPFANHRTTVEWAKDNIAHCFAYNILLNPDTASFNEYNKEGCMKTQYTIPTTVDKEEETVDIPAIDLEDDPENLLLQDLATEQSSELEDVKYWFHGTDYQSAINIAKNGIDLEKGKQGGDFSDGNGFYLTSSYKFAHAWPQKMKKKTDAVIVFKLDESCNPLASVSGRTFLTDDQEWKTLVRFFRNGKDPKECGPGKAKKLKKDKFVYGPISYDGSSSKNPNWQPRARDPLQYQLCIKDDEVAEKFYNAGRNIDQIIFFHPLSDNVTL